MTLRPWPPTPRALAPFFVDAAGLHILDQRALPEREVIIDCGVGDDVVEAAALAIETLAVRGAPAIGGAAALALATWAQTTSTSTTGPAFRQQLGKHVDRLARTRPTAVNLFVACDAIRGAVDVDAVVAAAFAYVDADAAACAAMGQAGAALVEDGDVVITICHTGALATCGQGTALGVVKSARQQGKDVAVVALETRPLLQGARLTAWECLKEGIPVTLITDGMAAFALARGVRGRRVRRAFVGADRIALNGDTANKIGTFGLAVACAHHGIPFHVVAPRSTFDDACADGAAIPIEERAAAEVRGVRGTQTAPVDVDVWNPSFDVTPGALIASFVSEAGVVSRR
jgi:methylthioribose-1-phosphate isomerase